MGRLRVAEGVEAYGAAVEAVVVVVVIQVLAVVVGARQLV